MKRTSIAKHRSMRCKFVNDTTVEVVIIDSTTNYIRVFNIDLSDDSVIEEVTEKTDHNILHINEEEENNGNEELE